MFILPYFKAIDLNPAPAFKAPFETFILGNFPVIHCISIGKKNLQMIQERNYKDDITGVRIMAL